MDLTNAFFAQKTELPKDLVPPTLKAMPEKVLQFGEGNFLRAFVDWMIERMNRQGCFNGRAVVVQPIEQGLVDTLNAQDGLFTLILRGLSDGRIVESKEIISSISRGLNPYTQWSQFLQCAENPDLRIVVSNTTEAGIAFNDEAFTPDQTQVSFPAKLAAFLYRRFTHFQADPRKGLLIFPCELIDKNGSNLRSIVLRLAKQWQMPDDFVDWVQEHNHFFNTLVDRIVTGYPKDDMKSFNREWGYRDRLVDTGEIFHLWVIEGDKRFQTELPLADIGLNVIWTDDLKPYRERKVRVLNGAHTMSFATAFLCGLDSVKAAVEDNAVGRFMRRGIFEEILPVLPMPEQEKRMFAEGVLERFQNPFIHHKWMDIALNSVSKFKTRCLPSIIDYAAEKGTAPSLLSFSLAALMVFYRGTQWEEGRLQAKRPQDDYLVSDDLQVLNFFYDAWSDLDPADGSALESMVKRVLARTPFWGIDLNTLPGLASRVTQSIQTILTDGMPAALARLLEETERHRDR
ncbi:MAG: tagaturonate reductase [Desulfobacteraceae bacterium]|jgi:tagaturonate reductase